MHAIPEAPMLEQSYHLMPCPGRGNVVIACEAAKVLLGLKPSLNLAVSEEHSFLDPCSKVFTA